MASEYEQAQDRLRALVSWYAENESHRNEATTRLHMIDVLLFECLGWSKDDAVLEEAHGGEYTDYTLRCPRSLLIVEAKKEGTYFDLPAGYRKIDYSISSICRENQGFKSAIEQAARYCQARGVPYGVVANGHQLVAFVASRYDGIPPLEGRALVFDSLSTMLDHFFDLWKDLSKHGIIEGNLARRLVGKSDAYIPPKLSSHILNYPGVKGRNVFQTDMQILSELVIEDLPRSDEIEQVFLTRCYARSGALSQYSLVAKNILQARYHALFEANTAGPTLTPATDKQGVSADMLSESLSRRPILLIGDVGVGKTTFLRHLMRVEAPAIFDAAISFYIDLGSQATLSADLRTFIPEEIIKQLQSIYGIDILDRNLVRGIYHGELERFSKGIYGDLSVSNPTLFAEKEIDFLGSKLENVSEHVRQSLTHFSKGWKKQIVVIIDNADQRDDGTQQQAFLIAQEISERWPAMVFVTLRPETFHRSAKTGALSGYHPKAFTISPPRIEHVIEKRLRFALQITSGELPVPRLHEMSVRLDDLSSLIRVLINSMERNPQLPEAIVNICGGNVRLALDMVRGFLGSGHVDTQKILDIVESQGSYDIPLHEFLRAVIYGDAAYFDPDRSVVANLFDISRNDSKEHFLLPILLGFLETRSGAGVEHGFAETHLVYEYLQTFGFTPNQVDNAIIRAVQKKLVESSGRRVPQHGHVMPESLRVTSVGLYHIRRLCSQFSYLDAVLVDTPILDQLIRTRIRDRQDLYGRMENAEVFQKYMDEQWINFPQESAPFDWAAISSEVTREIQRIRSRLQR